MSEVVTGEAVVLDVPFARFPSRALALAIDVAIQFVLLIVFMVVLGMIAAGGALDAASGAALLVTALVLILVGYPVTWETTTRGRSPGKFALGLRVVSDDGSPERFRQALVRGLAAVAEIWVFTPLPALVTSLLSAQGKRLGDLFAGTLVIQQRLPTRRSSAYLAVPPQLAAWAASLELSGLTEQTTETARRFLARWADLRPQAQAQLGAQIATAVSAQVSPPPPPGTPAPVYLSAVLAERRRREQARWLPAGPPPPSADPWQTANPWQTGFPAGPAGFPAPPARPQPAVPGPSPAPGAAWGAATRAGDTQGPDNGPLDNRPPDTRRPDQPPAGRPSADPPPASAGGFVPPA